jgi:hypothetical protein
MQPGEGSEGNRRVEGSRKWPGAGATTGHRATALHYYVLATRRATVKGAANRSALGHSGGGSRAVSGVGAAVTMGTTLSSCTRL